MRTALTTLGYQKITLSCEAKVIDQADAIILPGVGAFSECSFNFRQRHLDEILEKKVVQKGAPILGICVGMQLLAESSEEGGHHTGLGWIPGKVRRFNLPKNYAVPHVGWNEVRPLKYDSLFAKFHDYPDFYFDHSYHFECVPEHVLAYCQYGKPVVAAVKKGQIFGVQFHPEKSANNGLRLFRAFFNALDSC